MNTEMNIILKLGDVDDASCILTEAVVGYLRSKGKSLKVKLAEDGTARYFYYFESLDEEYGRKDI